MTQARTQAELLKTRVIDEVLREVATELSPHQYVSMDDVVASPKDIVDGPFGSNLKSEHYRSKGARVIRLQNIGVGKFIPNDSFISDDHFERLSKHEVRAGDLLFASLVESVPRTCIVPELESRAIVKADCIRIRVQPDVNTSWVFFNTRTSQATKWVQDNVHGIGRGRLGLGAIRAFPVLLPDRERQEAAVEQIEIQHSRIDSVIAELDAALNQAEVLRRSLLHAAFTGQLAIRASKVPAAEIDLEMSA